MNLKGEKIKCVVLCAGRGTRLGARDRPKPLYEVSGKPILFHIINFWKQFTNDFIFVVGYKKEMVMDFVKTLPVNAKFVEQKELKGIAHAVYLTKGIVADSFIVVLGDCLCTGDFTFPDDLKNGFGMFETDDVDTIRHSFSVELENGVAKRLVEKPRNPETNLCGMGFYFFTKDVFSHILSTPPSELRNEIEITDVMQKMIDAGLVLKPVRLDGKYINVTYPKDVKRAERMLNKWNAEMKE